MIILLKILLQERGRAECIHCTGEKSIYDQQMLEIKRGEKGRKREGRMVLCKKLNRIVMIDDQFTTTWRLVWMRSWEKMVIVGEKEENTGRNWKRSCLYLDNSCNLKLDRGNWQTNWYYTQTHTIDGETWVGEREGGVHWKTIWNWPRSRTI